MPVTNRTVQPPSVSSARYGRPDDESAKCSSACPVGFPARSDGRGCAPVAAVRCTTRLAVESQSRRRMGIVGSDYRRRMPTVGRLLWWRTTRIRTTSPANAEQEMIGKAPEVCSAEIAIQNGERFRPFGSLLHVVSQLGVKFIGELRCRKSLIISHDLLDIRINFRMEDETHQVRRRSIR